MLKRYISQRIILFDHRYNHKNKSKNRNKKTQVKRASLKRNQLSKVLNPCHGITIHYLKNNTMKLKQKIVQSNFSRNKSVTRHC